MTAASASFPVILGEFGCDVILQACRENLLSGSVPNLRRSLAWHETAAALEPNLTPCKREKFARQDICFEVYCSLLEIQILSVLCTKALCTPAQPRTLQAPVVQTLDGTLHGIKIYPVDFSIGLPNTYPLDRDLSRR